MQPEQCDDDGEYNEHLVNKLLGQIEAAKIKNAGAKKTRKMMEMQREARKTQERLVGKTSTFIPIKSSDSIDEVTLNSDTQAEPLDEDLSYIDALFAEAGRRLRENSIDDDELETEQRDLESNMDE